MDSVQKQHLSGRVTLVICAIFLLIYAGLSYSAVLTKSATIDEPSHLLSGWLSLRKGDFRLETVNPSLWKMFAALPVVTTNLNLPPDPKIWNDRTWNLMSVEATWTCATLFDTPGNDGAVLINRSRTFMLLLAIALGALVARWSYRLGGPVAAIIATVLFCLDPTTIAHGPMIKSDIAFALVLLSLSYLAWLVGQRATWGRIVSLGLVCAMGGGTKYSGLIVGPILAVMLALRAFVPEPWNVAGRYIRGFFGKLCFAVAVCVFAAVCCYGITWASYGFHFGPSPSPQVRMDMQTVYAHERLVETAVDIPQPTDQQIADHPPSMTYRFVQWADRTHFLPQPLLAGLLYQHACVTLWPAFLNGEFYGDGRWYYFPLAMLYKTPVSELTICALGLIGILAATRKFPVNWWTVICLAVPSGIFAGAALQTHLNIGLRNVLGLFPFLEIACGCAAAMFWRRWVAVLTLVLFTGLAIETLRAWPDYIAYFNDPSGGERGGIAHLSDSNLDWGQDVIGLANWQKEHPAQPLYTLVSVAVDPSVYGMKFHPVALVLDGPDAGQLRSDIPLAPGYLAVSAMVMQRPYTDPVERNFFQHLRQTTPIDVIGGTVYLYAFNP